MSATPNTEKIRTYFHWKIDPVMRYSRAPQDAHPLFCGRGALIARVLDRARALQADGRAQAEQAQVMCGPPGAGKTETLMQIHHAVRGLSTDERPVWVILAGDTTLRSARAFERDLQSQMPRPMADTVWGRANEGARPTPVSYRPDGNTPTCLKPRGSGSGWPATSTNRASAP